MRKDKIGKTLALVLVSGLLVVNSIGITYAEPDTEVVEGEVDKDNENELEDSILEALENDEETDEETEVESEVEVEEDSSLLDGY